MLTYGQSSPHPYAFLQGDIIPSTSARLVRILYTLQEVKCRFTSPGTDKTRQPITSRDASKGTNALINVLALCSGLLSMIFL